MPIHLKRSKKNVEAHVNERNRNIDEPSKKPVAILNANSTHIFVVRHTTQCVPITTLSIFCR